MLAHCSTLPKYSWYIGEGKCYKLWTPEVQLEEEALLWESHGMQRYSENAERVQMEEGGWEEEM